jgi:hypothetical protein
MVRVGVFSFENELSAMRAISLLTHQGGLASCGHFDFMVLHIFGFSF